MQEVYTPYQYFTDKNGLPLDAGFIYVGVANLDPVSNPVTVYYDAEGTIPAAQPLRTVNGTIVRNGSPARIYVFVDTFSVTVKTSNYRVVSYTSEASQLIDASHVTYKLTNVYDKLNEFISPIDFGAKFDGVTDDTVAIQAAINYASNNKSGKVWLPGGVTVISKLYFHYDAVKNPGFKQGDNYQGRIEFVGQGFGDKNNLKQSQYVGTTFISTITSGDVFTFNSGGKTHNKACVIGNFSVKAQTSDRVFYLKIATIGTIFENIVVYNNAAGTILEVENTWSSLFKNMQLAGDGSTGTGFAATGSTAGGGNIMLVNVNCEDLLQGFVFGAPYDAAKEISYVNVTTICCQAGECTTTGLALKQGILSFYGQSWYFEGCDSFPYSCSVKISDQAGINIELPGTNFKAGSIVFDGGWSTADQSDTAYSHFRIGTDSATSPNDSHGPVHINNFVFGNVYGSAIECANDAKNMSVTIDSPTVRFLGTYGRLLRIKDEVQNGKIKLRGKFETFSTMADRLCADATNAKMDHRIMYDYYGGNLYQISTSVQSANSLDIYPTDGDYVVIAANTRIDEILKPDFARRVVFRFTSNPDITANATPSSSAYAAIQTKTGSNIKTQVGAIIEMVFDIVLDKWVVVSNTSDEVFIYAGATTINEILTPTNAISLTYIFTGSPTVTNNYATPKAGYSVILLAGGVDFTASANDVLTLVYHPVIGKWLEKSRSVN